VAQTHSDINLIERHGATTIEVSGELDLSAAQKFDGAIRDLCEHPPREVTIDVRGLSFIDSIGLRALIEAQMRLEAVGCASCIIHRGGYVLDIIRMTGADKLLRLEERLEVRT
jgi:anti-anti-sigma factor